MDKFCKDCRWVDPLPPGVPLGYWTRCRHPDSGWLESIDLVSGESTLSGGRCCGPARAGVAPIFCGPEGRLWAEKPRWLEHLRLPKTPEPSRDL